MSWWWPFKKREAAQAEHDFREMLDQALLRQDDLEAATQRLKESRKPPKGGEEKKPPVVDAPPRPNARPRNV